jgi:Zn-finger nucleic acid-binding protein
MNCPTCFIDLKIAERQGIEIDYCPKCRGVWLDRGELDKLIERSTPSLSSSEPERRSRGFGDLDDGEDYDDYPRRGGRRRSFLGDLFDFD